MSRSTGVVLAAIVIGLSACALASGAETATSTSSSPAVTATQPPPAAPADESMESEPADAHELMVSADKLRKAGKLAEAAAICQQAYQSATDDDHRAFWLRFLGKVYEKKEFDRAIAIYRQVIAQFPRSVQVPYAKHGIAFIYCEKAAIANPKENLALAMPMLEEVLRDYPDYKRAGWVMRRLGLCYAQLGDEQTALAKYLEGVRLHPTWRDIHECMAAALPLLQRFGRQDEAIAMARRYVEVCPAEKRPDGQLILASCYAQKGDLATAIIEFDQVLARYPTAKSQCAMALLYRAGAQKSLGLLPEARATWEQLIRDYPQDPAVEQARREIEELNAR